MQLNSIYRKQPVVTLVLAGLPGTVPSLQHIALLLIPVSPSILLWVENNPSLLNCLHTAVSNQTDVNVSIRDRVSYRAVPLETLK